MALFDELQRTIQHFNILCVFSRPPMASNNATIIYTEVQKYINMDQLASESLFVVEEIVANSKNIAAAEAFI